MKANYSGGRSPGELSHSFIWEAVSSCLIFLSSASLWGPYGRSATCSSKCAFSAAIGLSTALSIQALAIES